MGVGMCGPECMCVCCFAEHLFLSHTVLFLRHCFLMALISFHMKETRNALIRNTNTKFSDDNNTINRNVSYILCKDQKEEVKLLPTVQVIKTQR